MSYKPKLVTSNDGLKVKNLRITLSKKQIVRNVSLELQRGKVVGLLGPNGAGKTTSLLSIIGLIKADGGEITLNGNDLIPLPMYKRARLGISYLPQNPSVFRYMSVEDNLLSILELKKYPRDQKQNILEELLTEFSLNHLRHAQGYQLSGGERRRTEIARCLCADPSVIILDEPTAALDPIGVDDMKNLIKKLAEKNLAVLLTDHNIRHVLDITDYNYIVYGGEIIAEGDSQSIIGNSKARKFYLGETFKY